MPRARYKAIDLFCGIGGIRLGFERAFGGDLETVFASEIDAQAAATYSANFPVPAVAGDITQVGADEVPVFDVCLAGFPCQAFSEAGNRRGFDDDYHGRARGTLFFEVARICDRHRPAVVFCENVRGLPKHAGGETFRVILGTFAEMGYVPFHAILNSRDFGVGQHRERVYIVAFREDVAPEAFEFPQGAGEAATIAGALDAAPVPAKYYLSERYLGTLMARTERNHARGNRYGAVVRDLDGVSGALICGGMGYERNLIVDSRGRAACEDGVNSRLVRKLTPREWARLQGFPEDFAFPLSDTATYKQLGNSVTVPVIEAVARRVRDVLEG